MELIGIIAAIVSAASWACGTLVFDNIGRSIPSAGLTFIKGALSIVLMGLATLFYGEISHVDYTQCLYLALSGIIGIALGDTFFFKSLKDLGAKTQVLFFMLGQIMTMLLSFLFLGEVLSVNKYIGALVLLVGVVIVMWGKQEGHPNKLRGVVYGLLSILCFSVSSIIVKASIADLDVFTATFYRMTFGTLFIICAGMTTRKVIAWMVPLLEWRLALKVFFNVIVITFGGFLLSMVAFKHISVSLASVLSTSEPLFVLLFAYMFYHEKATKRELLGASISIMAILFIILYE